MGPVLSGGKPNAPFFLVEGRGSTIFGPLAGGALSLAVGFTIMIWAWKLFRMKGTAVHPFEESTHLVTHGPYRFTRNPMYSGITFILLGIAFFAGTPPAFLAPLLFLITIHRIFIPYEEKKMETRFGKEYLDFKRRVRRWL